MIWTAVAIAETGQIGQARGRDLTVPRPEGDSVSRFGLAMSLAQVPAALLAPAVESRLGPATSQPLFLIAPFIFVLAAAVFSALAVRELGGSLTAQRLAIVFATLGSPLGVYAGLDASESLQAASLVLALWASLVAGSSSVKRSVRASVLAGAACGVAVLTKSSLLVIAPLMLLPLLAGDRKSRRMRLGLASMTFVAAVTVWLYYEVTRFGSPLMGYAGEGFTHSPVDGAWRLFAGVNKGLLWYFPALAVVVLSSRRALSGAGAQRRLVFIASIAALLVFLATASGWWAWHGDDGWGPRLLVPVLPMLAVCAALAMEGWPAPARTALVAVSFVVNLPALLQHPTPVFHYRLSASWPAADPAFASTLPRFARREVDGKTVVVPESVLANVPRASPFVVLPWYFKAMHTAGVNERSQMLRRPPWIDARPDIAPSESLVASLSTSPSRWPFWGRSFLSGGINPESGTYDAALVDQILRAVSLRETSRAEALSRKLLELAPSGYADALLLEVFRLEKRRPEAVRYLTNLSQDRRQHPAINVVLALFERDTANDATARAFLRSVASSFPDSPVERALSQPLALWPPDFAAMTQDDRLQVDIR